MKKIISSVLLVLVLSTSSFASCLPAVESKIVQKQEKLLFAKMKEKKILIRTAMWTGIPSTMFWGVMAKAMIDGGTIASSIIVGASFGVMIGGTATAAVAVPMITYNQIVKAQIRKYKKTSRLLTAALDNNQDDKILKKMLRKIKRKNPSMTMDTLISDINYHSDKLAFCPEAQGKTKVFSFRKIKKYLLGTEQDLEATTLKVAIGGDSENTDVLDLDIDLAN